MAADTDPKRGEFDHNEHAKYLLETNTQASHYRLMEAQAHATIAMVEVLHEIAHQIRPCEITVDRRKVAEAIQADKRRS